MEVTTADNLTDLIEVQPFDTNSFRSVSKAAPGRSIYAPNHGVLQHIYNFDTGHLADLSLRRTIGLSRLGSVYDLIWVKAHDAQGESIFIGVESEYVYERTGMLITPGLAGHANQKTIPVYPVIEAVLFEVEPILGFEVQRLLLREELPDFLTLSPLQDYIALDHKGSCKLLIASTRECLDLLEAEARNYCFDYLNSQREWSKKIRALITLGAYPVKRYWNAQELGSLDVGDLLALKGSPTNDSCYLLNGFLQLRRTELKSFKYEVQYYMSDDDLTLSFTGDTIDDYQEPKIEIDVPPHEQIELDILIGHTSIPLGELCAVQSGTLIELGQHSLPIVTLCVNGDPILEGELVHFKDQIMVQVTKRLA